MMQIMRQITHVTSTKNAFSTPDRVATTRRVATTNGLRRGHH